MTSGPASKPHAGRSGPARQSPRLNWPWHPFVVFAVWMALLPGFLLGALAGGARIFGLTPGPWYAAAVQAHAHALLVGWGGGMIFGVALHFLPRIRGARLTRPEAVPPLFWLLAGGTVLRALGQPLAAVFDDPSSVAGQAFLYGAVSGIFIQALALIGLLLLLAETLRSGPPIGQKKAFAGMAPLLALTAMSIGLAMLVLLAGSADWILEPGSPLLIGGIHNRLAVDLLLLGFIVPMSIVMSSRLFQLSFRIEPADPRLLKAAALLLSGGVLLISFWGAGRLLAGVHLPFTGPAALLSAAGIVAGSLAVQVFRPRKAHPGDRDGYRIYRHPAAAGALSAYIWANVGAVFLVLSAGETMGIGVLPGTLGRDPGLHALGAGFMTLLIISVGWTMLPGFAGGRPQAPGFMWAAIALGNFAVLLRVLPGLWPAVTGARWDDPALLMALAGMAGLASIAAFAVALSRSWEKR